MSAFQPRAYGFLTEAHWQRCVRIGLEIVGDALQGVAPPPPARRRAAGDVRALGLDPHGTLRWRTPAGLCRLDAGDQPGPALEVDALLRRSPRLLGDRTGWWAFEPGSTVVGRFDGQTLLPDLRVDIAPARPAQAAGAGPAASRVVDIARDGCGGLWLLLRGADGHERLEHLDDEGRRCGPAPALPPGPHAALGSLGRAAAQVLVLLTADGRSLRLLQAADGTLRRELHLDGVLPGARAAQLATDGRRRIALWEPAGDARQPPRLVLLDAEGEPLGPAFTPLPGTPGTPGADVPALHDVAPGRDTLWLGSDTGLWQLPLAGGETTASVEGTLLTPLLDSPPSEAGRGWLRAEADLALPMGAVLEARCGSTDDPVLAAALTRLLSDATRSGAARREALWARVGEPGPVCVIAGPGTPGVAPAVPLFAQRGRWLWLELRLVVPPGVAVPPLRGLRVRYPERSLVERLPAIFRGEDGDPGAFLRRLAGVIETTTQDLDARIAGLGVGIDPATAPDAELDRLAGWLGLPWDEALPPAAKRELLRAAPDLMAWRGTRAGLHCLLCALVGLHGVVAVADPLVEHAPGRLGGGRDGLRGPTLPLLLAGASTRAATLGAKAVLGRARLRCGADDADPLRGFVPTVLIRLAAEPALRRALAPLLDGLLAQYLPTGVRWRLRWSTPPAPGIDPQDGPVLDGPGPGRLSTDGALGRTVLAGRGTGRIDATGLDLGFHL